ncbi:MAG: hypothetical protein JWO10_1142, partial [Microbacteriaceae bacterium]|nr:hypothetical protein [Microbacteriaceae bacterium]
LGAGNGAQIRSIAAGVVTEADTNPSGGLGVYVVIQHVIDGAIVSSAYGHMQVGSMTLSVGDSVYSGQPIGLVGQTGVATAPHLHFEIRLGGTQRVDGAAWLHAKLG